MQVVARFRTMWEDKSFLHKTLTLAVPVAVQGFLNTTLNLIDSLMIGTLGESTIAAVGLANKVFFVLTLLLFGICSGSGVLTSQYWGQKDVANIRKILGLSLILGLIGSLLFLAPAMLMPRTVMRIFTPSQEAIGIGATYLFGVAVTYPLTAVTMCYISVLRSVNQVKAPMIISFIALLVNAGINYVLIFGKLGFSPMGVKGAAIGTVIARVVECDSLLILVYRGKGPAAARISEMVGYSKAFVGKFFHTASPVIANEFMWGLGITMYSLVYGRMGDDAVAAITITQTFEQVLQVVFQSLSASTAVILGNMLGANRLDKANEYSKNFILLQFLLTLVIAVICYFMRWPIIGLYTVSDHVAKAISMCFLVYIAYMPFKMFNFVNIVGILRSGGDTTAALLLDTVGIWVIGIPLAYLGGIVLGYPIYIVYAMVMVEEFFKFILGLKRYQQKKWLRNIIVTKE